MLRNRAAAAAVLAAASLAGCAAGQARTAAQPGNPLAGTRLFADPAAPAAQQVAEWRAEHRLAEAAALERIAAQPAAHWFAGGEDVQAAAARLTARASAAGAVPVLVAYDIPHRDCAGFSAGGTASATAYGSWIGRLAAGIGPRRAIVILEPDAVAQTLTGCVRGGAADQRYALLAAAVRTLKARPGVHVYIDAGNAGWIRPAARLAAPLRRAGIARADGFALNVSNFYSTPVTVAYGDALSRALGGAHFVIDTGRNGRGPDTRAADAPSWCNPPGRALGADPTTATGRPLVDAYLWVKEPGASDGSCRPGEPQAGRWWPQYALALARSS